MSPENGFKFRTGHNGTQLGQWQLDVCSGWPALDVHVWSTCEQVQVPPFPNSQALSNVKTVATIPWEGPALSHVYCL